jgi:GntR family transcriptional regulator/MocR family aminotransferase
LLIHLQPDPPVPLYRQVELDIRTGIRQGRLRPGTRMPSTRALAANLGVSRGVVVEAYQQLIAEGYLASRPDGYTEIATAASATPPRWPRRLRHRASTSAIAGPDASQFPRAAWLRSIRRALNEAPHDRFNYLDGRGAPEPHRELHLGGEQQKAAAR